MPRGLQTTGRWLSIAAFTFTVAACGGPPPPRRPGTLTARRRPVPAQPSGPTCAELHASDEPRACVVATLDDEAGAMEVRIEIPADALPEGGQQIRLGFRERTFGDAYAATFVQTLDRDRWPASFGVGEPVTLHYRVDLGFFERGDPPDGRRGVSWRRPNGWHLTGKTFLPDVWVDGEPAQVPATLLLEVGDRPLFSAAGSDSRVFDADSLSRLADEAYEVGPMTTTRRDVGRTTIYVGTSGDGGDERLARMADTIERAVAAIIERLGPPQTDTLLYAFHPVGASEPGAEHRAERGWAERLGASLVQVGPELPADPLYGEGAVSFHELGRLWNPGRHAIAEDWIADGLTDLLAVQIAAELGSRTDEALARVVLRRHAAYVAGAGERTVRDASPADPRWVRDAGLVTGFCLDVRLREAGSSLWAVMRMTLDRDEEALGTEALLEDLAAVAPSAASYLEVRVGTRGAFEVEDCLERFGFEVREATFEAPTDQALAADVLGILGSRTATHTQSLEVAAVGEETPLEVGDVVLRVADHPVAELADVAWALRDVAAGEAFTIRLRRGGRETTVERVRPEGASPDGAERTYLELVPVSAAASEE